MLSMGMRLSALVITTVVAGAASACALPPAAAAAALSAQGAEVRLGANGLTWQRCAHGQQLDGAACRGKPALLTWDEARDHAPAGWRLPTLTEWQAMQPHLADARGVVWFPDAPDNAFWTATEAGEGEVWGINARAASPYRYRRDASLAYVRWVRVAQP
jgi:hypothetical protein